MKKRNSESCGSRRSRTTKRRKRTTRLSFLSFLFHQLLLHLTWLDITTYRAVEKQVIPHTFPPSIEPIPRTNFQNQNCSLLVIIQRNTFKHTQFSSHHILLKLAQSTSLNHMLLPPHQFVFSCSQPSFSIKSPGSTRASQVLDFCNQARWIQHEPLCQHLTYDAETNFFQEKINKRLSSFVELVSGSARTLPTNSATQHKRKGLSEAEIERLLRGRYKLLGKGLVRLLKNFAMREKFFWHHDVLSDLSMQVFPASLVWRVALWVSLPNTFVPCDCTSISHATTCLCNITSCPSLLVVIIIKIREVVEMNLRRYMCVTVIGPQIPSLSFLLFLLQQSLKLFFLPLAANARIEEETVKRVGCNNLSASPRTTASLRARRNLISSTWRPQPAQVKPLQRSQCVILCFLFSIFRRGIERPSQEDEKKVEDEILSSVACPPAPLISPQRLHTRRELGMRHERCRHIAGRLIYYGHGGKELERRNDETLTNIRSPVGPCPMQMSSSPSAAVQINSYLLDRPAVIQGKPDPIKKNNLGGKNKNMT
ncbi:hypothetical protein VP01_4348g2 [Puccinia sorghi]|uniref:Uncharacterized protein n=1 Tax=Puccinia sorghi TaxID=27349 RepID=A0A0L6UPW2_9BASI|nr:hypothetical protein VP01_4348g2 [Puccinia sorghi]